MSQHEQDEAIEERTREAERHEARASHGADRPPTPDEVRAAEKNQVSEETRERAHEMGRIGAEVKGEGQID